MACRTGVGALVTNTMRGDVIVRTKTKPLNREVLRETLETRMRGSFREACDCIIAGDENAEKAVCKYEAYARWYALNGFDLELFESRLGMAS